MAQKKKAAARTARKTIELPAPKAAPLLAAARPTVASAAAKAPAADKPQAPVRQVAKTAGNNIGDLETVGRKNFEACVKCGTIVAKGVETLGNEVMTLTQANIEADLAAAKDILAAKTLQEAIDVQAGFVQARLERLTSETAKLGEISMRLASQAMEPLQNRFDANTQTIFRSLGR